MTLTDRILDLKRQGTPDYEIEMRLRNEGVSPMEINDAMNQSKIKEAVSGEGNYSKKGMVPSIMGGSEEEEKRQEEPEEEDTYTPSPAPSQNQTYSDYSAQEPGQSPYPPYYSDSSSEEEYYEETPSEENYENNPQNYPMNSETIIEVAEQVFFEKVKKIEEDLKKLKEFMTVSAPAIEDIDERLKRIEKNFDKMQIAILDRVGSFGKNIDSLKKEVEMVEDSFEKLNRNKK
ncbi:hypothetical protein J4411_00415 [Candidatus Pacearchaeota archaeon]|nr:hypothetical protein [uncultured archaeon]MBS3084361.1 hypothetical protein [Candidatus Pacearchaeota archaeon]